MSEALKVIYAPAARDDLRDIASYIIYTLNAPDAAKNVTQRIRATVRSLSTLCHRYALVEWEPWASMNMHRVPVGNYIVFYMVDDDVGIVTITRILYSGRNIEHLIQDSEE